VPSAHAPQGDDLGVVIFGHVSHGTHIWVDVHAEAKRARLG
jgi:hypothetical protein